MTSILFTLTSSFRELARRRAAQLIGLGLVLLLVLAVALDISLGTGMSTSLSHHGPVAVGVAWGHG